MLITKFNKMIRNRIVWWIIGGITIITFVGWFSPRGGCETVPQQGEAGTLNGEPVTDIELRQARFNTYLEFCMMTGRKAPITPELDTALTELAWKRVAALRMAKSLGIQAPTDDELLNEIQAQSVFQADGAFSRTQYRTFERNVLAPLGASMAQFEDKLREDLILSKLHRTASAAAWISPMETQRLISRYADTFRVDYVTLQTNLVSASDVKVTEADLKAFYADHTNLFEVPARVAVRYVSFPISNHLAGATVASNAVEEYYDTHIEEFTVAGTNYSRTVTPFEEVQGTLSNRLVRDTATQVARDLGTEFVVDLAPARDGSASVFETVAAQAGLSVKTTGLFDVDSDVPGIDAGRDFTFAAHKLRPTPEDYFSDAVTGDNHVYVLALATNVDAFVPPFEDVRAKVEPLARAKAAQDALVARASAVRQKFVEGLGKGETFAALAKQQAMNVSTTAFFSAFSAPAALQPVEVLENIVDMDRGEVSSPLATTNGLLLVYLADRKPATAEEANVVRSQLGAKVTRQRGSIVFSSWQDAIVRAGRKLHQAPSEDEGESR